MNFRPTEIQYRDLYSNAPVAYFTVDAADGSILDCNQAAREISGYSRKALLQMKIFELYADARHGLPGAQKIFEDFQAGQPIRNIELQVERSNGALSWVSLSVEPEIDPVGKTIRSLYAMVDISDRKQAQIAPHEAQNNVQFQVNDRVAELVAENVRLKREIEERRQAETASRENAETMHVLLNVTTHLVFLLDLDGSVVTANEQACISYGKTLDELRGLNIFSRMPAETAKSIKRLAAAAIQSKLPVSDLEEINGNFYEYFIYPILDEKGIVRNYAVFSEDVTSLKLAERALSNSETKFRMLVEGMNDGLAMLDENDLHSYVNDRFCAMLGYSRKELGGQPATALLDSDNRKIFKREIAARKNGKRTAYEMAFRHKNGSRISTIISPQPLLHGAGHYKGSFAIITDITWMKQAQAALRESENNFKKLAENARDGIVLIEKDGKTAYVNSWCEKISGYSAAEIMKDGVTAKLVDPAKREMHLAKLRKRLAGEPVPNRYETEIIAKSGRIVPVEITASKTIWHGHAVVLLIVRDITSQKQTESKLLREQLKLENRVMERTRELEGANKALSVLARKIDQKREKIQENTAWTVNSRIMPIIEALQKNKALADYRTELNMLKTYINKISLGFKKETGIIFSLSNAELRIATMIKSGFTSPQIARLLSVSLDTVKTHRKKIRRKLNIHNSKINLVTYLRAKLN